MKAGDDAIASEREAGRNEDRYSPGVPLTVTVPVVTRRDRPRRRLRPACRARLSLVSQSTKMRRPRGFLARAAVPALLFRFTRDARRREAIDGPRRGTPRDYADTHEREDCEAECGRNHSERSHRSAATGRSTTDSEAGKGRTAASRAPLRSAARKLRRTSQQMAPRPLAYRGASWLYR